MAQLLSIQEQASIALAILRGILFGVKKDFLPLM